MRRQLGRVANILHPDVPVAATEDGNRVDCAWGLETKRPAADAPLAHHDLLHRIGGYEPERGAAIAGHRGYFLTGPGVLLNQALVSYGNLFLNARGYSRCG
jgi:seryl-tRNA synthetase